MTKIDLITGILGSGKTTWIHQYAEHLIQQGQRIAILEKRFRGQSMWIWSCYRT